MVSHCSQLAGTDPGYALWVAPDWSQSAGTESDHSVADSLKKQAASVCRLADSVVGAK